MLSCSSLVIDQDIDLQYNATNDTNATLINLEFETRDIFDASLSFNRPSFWISSAAIVVIVFIISSIIVSLYYPYYDRKQKLRLFISLGGNPYSKKEVIPQLAPYTHGVKVIEETICEFAQIDDQSVDSLIQSSLGKKSTSEHLRDLLLVSTLLLASHFQFYWVISHWDDSYISYVETRCYPVASPTDRNDYYFYNQVDMNALCEEDVSAYTFYVDTGWHGAFNRTLMLSAKTADSNSEACYVRKDTLAVRAARSKCSCCIRCGYCCQCEGCFNGNGCGYACCIVTALTSCICFFWWYCAKLYLDLSQNYQVQRRPNVEMTAMHHGEERLLTVQATTGQI